MIFQNYNIIQLFVLSTQFLNMLALPSVMSIDMNHFTQKKINVRYGIAYGGFWAGARRAEGKKPPYAAADCLRGELLFQKLWRALVSKCPHRFVVAPDQMLGQLPIQILHAAKAFPIIEIPLVVSVASFYFPIMPRCSRRDQLMPDPQPAKLFVEWAFLCFTDVFVGKFSSVICLDSLNSERKRFYQPGNPIRQRY